MEEKLKVSEGVSIALAFFISSLVLYFNPTFLGNEFATSLTGALFGMIGIAGFLLEISKVMHESMKQAYSDLGIATFFGLPMVLLLYFFSNTVVNVIAIVLLIFTLYAFFRGVSRIIILSEFNGKNIIYKIPLLLLNLSVFSVSVMQIINMLGLNK